MLSKKAREIAKRPAFPNIGDGALYDGMTYHQWLVGQALAGLAGWEPDVGAARFAVSRADAACEALAEREP